MDVKRMVIGEFLPKKWAMKKIVLMKPKESILKNALSSAHQNRTASKTFQLKNISSDMFSSSLAQRA